MGTTTCRCIKVLVAMCLLVAATALLPVPAMAQAPSTIFQLDGNSAQTGGYPCTGYTAPCDYWNLINGTGTSGSGRGHSALNVFIAGATNSTSYAQGSKDTNLLSQNNYGPLSCPPKDCLNAGYAAAYDITDFDVIFGADRATPNGDANIGIWFFQQNVTLNGTGGFNGAHVNGDVFVISAFTGGGGTSTISVYSWNSACTSGVKNPTVGQCADTNLELIADPTTVCTSTSDYCAITNSGTVTASWASYSSGTLASPLFFEGGVDITAAFAALHLPVPCFASFLEETRSSQSTTATLKDFLLGSFPVCSMSITKTCGTPSVNAGGTEITYPVGGTVTNTGIGTLYGVEVIDTITGGATNTIAVGTLAPKASAVWNDSSQSASSSESDSAYAQGSSSPGGTPLNITSTNTASVTCTLAVSTTLTVSKSCKTTLQVSGNQVSVLVSYGGMVCNTGPSEVTGISLEDYPDSSNAGGTGASVATGITLGPGTSASPTCQSYASTYSPTLIDQTITGSDGIAGDGAGRYFFSDLVTIPTATPALGSLTKVTSSDPRTSGTYGYATASCPICQGSSECTP